MNPNKYFLAVVVSAVVTLIGLAVMLLRSSPALYHQVLQICGLSWETCSQVVNSINPLTLIIMAIFVWLVTVASWQLFKTKLVLMKVRQRIWPTPGFLMGISLRSGTGGKISVVDGTNLFCAGLIRPRVYIGREILKRLTDNELAAALAHESYHLRSYDPLKVWLATSLAKGLFFIPVISLFARGYLLNKELAADELAEAKVGKTSLSKALYKVMRITTNPIPGNLVTSFASVRKAISEPIVQGSWYLIIGVSVIAVSLIVSGLAHPAIALGGCQ